MRVDEDARVSELSENETMALNDACFAREEIEKAY